MEDLVFNARLRLTRVHHLGEVVAMSLLAPARGGGPRANRVTRAKEPRTFAVLEQIASSRGALDAEVADDVWARLVELGVLVPPGSLLAPVWYRAAPTGMEAPRTLLPRAAARAVQRWADCAPTLRVAESLACGTDPTVLAGGPGPFGTATAWARVDRNGAPILYSLDDRASELFARLRPGEQAPSLAPDVLADLATAGVLIDDGGRGRCDGSSPAATTAAAQLARARWTVLREMVHPFTIAALRRYYRELVGEGHLPFGDSQVARRYGAHDEPLARVLQQQLAPLVSAAAGSPFKPSYAYFASYRAGATLAPHRDRDQCELSISLLIDYEPEPEAAAPSAWPIYLGEPGSATTIELGLGDGLLYRGAELTHHREALPDGHASTSLFLHYVPESFTGSLA